MTVIKECAEELGFPAAILSPDEFKHAVNSIDLSVVGVFNQIEFITPFYSERITQEGTTFKQPWMNAFYMGYYDGSIRFKDGESCGIQVFSLDELCKELEINDNKFTQDVKFMVERYKPHLIPLKK